MSHYLDCHVDLGDVVPGPVAHIETLRSVWVVDAHRYVRLPKSEAPDESRAVQSPWGRLRDAEALPYRRAFWSQAPDGTVILRVIPVAGPPDGRGIHTSAIVQVSGIAPSDPLRAISGRDSTVPSAQESERQ